MSSLPLFKDIANEVSLHPIYRMIRDGDYEPERQVLLDWSSGFKDRDGKFCHEFQTNFEPCLWELYLHAYFKEIGANVDFSHQAPDFVVEGLERFCVEATISAPALGGAPPYGHSISDMPEDFSRFNSEATIRLCNSFSSKTKKLRRRYSTLSQCANKPFVIAIASFDRPFSHMAAMRPIISALYGLYHDEGQTMEMRSDRMICYNVDRILKNENTPIDLGYFCSPEYSDVSAVIFSNLATWGKVRAVADNPAAHSIYTTYHPNPGSLLPIVKHTPKAEYSEHLLDGLCVLHNPFATSPLSPETLAHERLAQVFVRDDGELVFVAPDDFLLMRSLMSVKTNGNTGESIA